MRIRTVKPEFWTSEGVASCSVEARLTFIGLWQMADDFGNGKANPLLVKAALFPMDDEVDVAAYMDELENAGLIVRYEADGRTFFHVPSWEKHQAAAYRRGEAQFPAPSVVPESAGREGKGTGNVEGNGTEGIAPETAHTNGKPTDPIWDVLVECYGEPTHRDKRNHTAKVLRDFGAEPDEVRWMIANLTGTEKDWAITTPEAIASHFGERIALVAQIQARSQNGASRAKEIAAELRRRGE